MDFTFVNTTDAPRLSSAEAKRMRAHVTRTNFSERRRKRTTVLKLTGAVSEVDNDERLRRQREVGSIPSPRKTAIVDSTLPYSVLQTVMIKYWRDDPVDSPGCREWEAFVLSEPALFEGIVGVNMRHWSPAPAFQKRAEDHSSRAVSIIINHIRSGTAHQDGVLGAVATMALSESLDRNEKSWRMHLDGLAQILEERKARGVRSMPSWFTGFIVMDLMNNVLGYPRVYNTQVVQALAGNGHPDLTMVLRIGAKLVKVRKTLADYRNDPETGAHVADRLTEMVDEIDRELRVMQTNKSAYMRAASVGARIFLRFAWPTEAARPDQLTRLGCEMKHAVCEFPFRQCPYMDLTSTTFVMGFLAAENDSPTKWFFLSRMRHVVAEMQSRGWDRPDVYYIERAIESDAALLHKFRAVFDPGCFPSRDRPAPQPRLLPKSDMASEIQRVYDLTKVSH